MIGELLLLWGFCPRVPVHKNRYNRPNNMQQLNKGFSTKKYNSYSLRVPVHQDTTVMGVNLLTRYEEGIVLLNSSKGDKEEQFKQVSWICSIKS